jgi:TldD protein
MTDITTTDELFFSRAGLNKSRVQNLVDDALMGADDGELFLEYCQSESIVFDDGQVKSAAFDTSQGFGLRAISGEVTGYSQASDLSEEAIKRAGKTVKSISAGKGGTFAAPPKKTYIRKTTL